jgi:hypothetical protein
MGRNKPAPARAYRSEIAAARAVDETAARLLPVKDTELTDEQVRATIGAVTAVHERTLPIVLLDGFEITQEVQDLAHSVPLVADKGTIVRAYLRYPADPVTVGASTWVSA